jgi:NDP-hexose-3-ketoreductase
MKFGIIGTGYIANKAFIPALKSANGAELSAVADALPEKARDTAQIHGVDYYEKPEELLTSDKIDAVYIATPNSEHVDLCIEAAKSGKHIICEKPLAPDFDSAERMVNACKENNVALLEGFSYQFHTQHKKLKEFVNAGTIGEPVNFQAWFGFPPLPDNNPRWVKLLGGGALLDAGTYTVHSARKFFGTDAEVLGAKLSITDSREVEVYGSALLGFDGAKSANLNFGFKHYYRNSYAIWGTEGLIYLTRAYSIPGNFMPSLVIERQSYREEHQLAPCDQFKEEIEVFVENHSNAIQRQTWYEDALNQARTLDGIRKFSLNK